MDFSPIILFFSYDTMDAASYTIHRELLWAYGADIGLAEDIGYILATANELSFGCVEGLSLPLSMDKIASPDEGCNKSCRRLQIDIFGCPELLDPAVLQDHDAIGHREGFPLVMRDEDHGSTRQAMDTFDFFPHRDTQISIECG